MEDQAQERRRRPVLLLVLLAALLTVSVTTGLMSLALFTDSQIVDDNQFSVGSIELTATPATALFTATALMPGDVVSESLVIANAGTAQFRYAMTSSSVDGTPAGLAAALLLEIRDAGTDCATFDGDVVYSGTLDDAAFGDPAAGDDTGDRVLGAGVDETLCFQVTLPSSAADALQGASTVAAFTFQAEQTANNP